MRGKRPVGSCYGSFLQRSVDMVRVFLYILASICLLICGCSSNSEMRSPDTVSVQLKYYHQAQFAGLYVAEYLGYFRDENIDVTFLEGGRGVDIITPVAAGDIDFGIASSDHILISRTQGVAIRAIAAIYRRSAAIFVAKAGSGIQRPYDMVGKRIAVYSKNAKEYEYELRAMLKKLGIDIGRTQLVDLDHQYEGFLKGDVDVTGAYVTGGALRLQAKGMELNYIWPIDYGIDFYSDTLFTSDTLIEKNPELVQRFLRAALRGWDYAIRNSEEAVDITMKYARIQDRSLQMKMMAAQHPLIYTGEDSIGWMEDRVWQGMHQILFEQGVIQAPLSDIHSAFTNEFVEAITEEQ